MKHRRLLRDAYTLREIARWSLIGAVFYFSHSNVIVTLLAVVASAPLRIVVPEAKLTHGMVRIKVDGSTERVKA